MVVKPQCLATTNAGRPCRGPVLPRRLICHSHELLFEQRVLAGTSECLAPDEKELIEMMCPDGR
jgi:hypothetical protein